MRFISVDLPHPDGPTMVQEFAVVDLQIGFEQRLHAPALGAEDVTDARGSRSLRSA